jgi:hypothetical protein
MAFSVYPTEAPIGTFEGDNANRMREFQIAEYLKILKSSPLDSFVYSGGTVSIGAGIVIAAGTYAIDGYVVVNDAAEEVAVPGGFQANTSYYAYARLIKTGSLVTSAEYTYVTAADAPAEPTSPAEPHVLIGKIAGGIAYTSKTCPTVVTGSYNSTGLDFNSIFFTGFQPKVLEYVATNYLGSAVRYCRTLQCTSSFALYTIDVELQPTPAFYSIQSYGFILIDDTVGMKYWAAYAS